jgi:hypothetical protein
MNTMAASSNANHAGSAQFRGEGRSFILAEHSRNHANGVRTKLSFCVTVMAMPFAALHPAKGRKKHFLPLFGFIWLYLPMVALFSHP